ncbi:MAG: hypothetical protein WB764_12910 [Xanthobacteraceae bacterium]
MIRQPKHSRVLHELWLGEMHLAYAGRGQGAATPRRPLAAPTTTQLPRRPDASVFSEAIPLFYIGRNKSGLWAAREAAGGSGGLFLLKQSAARFARRQSEPAGCAMMFLAEPFDLDVENRGGRVAGLLAAAAKIAVRLIGPAIAEWRKLVAEISNAFSSQRRHREAIERELFRGQYTLTSKNDDDLPVP